MLEIAYFAAFKVFRAEKWAYPEERDCRAILPGLPDFGSMMSSQRRMDRRPEYPRDRPDPRRSDEAGARHRPCALRHSAQECLEIQAQGVTEVTTLLNDHAWQAEG